MALIENPAIDKNQLPQLGATVTGVSRTVTIDDIIAVEGARIPDAAHSQKRFRIGFVLLVRPDSTPGNASAAVEILRNSWAGRFVELTRGIGGITDIPPLLNIVIDSPAENAIVTGRDIAVTGTVLNTTGAETGIFVNGIPATVNGNRFVVNQVPLQEGTNTLDVKATDVNGLSAVAGRSVTATAGHYLRIISNIESGVAPMQISLRIDGSFRIVDPVVTSSGPVPSRLQTGATPNEYTLSLVSEGNYSVSATAIGPDGQRHDATIQIIVLPRYQMESLLQEKWKGINNKVLQKDVEGAVAYLMTSKRAFYRKVFTRLGDKLPQLALSTPSLELVTVSDDQARCRVFRDQIVQGQPVTVGYPVYFEKENGIWRLPKY
jgi:uncharacterized Zn-binding protein involved in type VI secretion